jgi:hypothetical protein
LLGLNLSRKDLILYDENKNDEYSDKKHVTTKQQLKDWLEFHIFNEYETKLD